MRTINVLLVSLLLSRFSTTDANGRVMSAAEMVKVQNSVEAVKVAASGTEVGADTSTTWNDVSTAYTAKATGNLAAKSLQEMAQTTWAEASWAKTAKDFYAADGRMSTDQFATAVIAGDGAFGKDTYNPGRIEAIKKATHDEIQINYVLGAAQHAVSTSDTADWEAAAALYFGALLADVDDARLATTSGYHPSTVANKRCANFGTCPADGTTDVRPAAPQNIAIKAAFDLGFSAENYQKIRIETGKQLVRIYEMDIWDLLAELGGWAAYAALGLFFLQLWQKFSGQDEQLKQWVDKRRPEEPPESDSDDEEEPSNKATGVNSEKM